MKGIKEKQSINILLKLKSNFFSKRLTNEAVSKINTNNANPSFFNNERQTQNKNVEKIKIGLLFSFFLEKNISYIQYAVVIK